MEMDPEEFTPVAQDEVLVGEEPINVVGTIEPSIERTQMRDVLAEEIFIDQRNRRRNQRSSSLIRKVNM